ncbi:hypothetical protein [uncultured Nocardioides sp.]|uniref:hypothetical protein n=1 Tax=uncultured Nocardioides sp. TaxID=198441 RepID=UPI002604FE15|nr:hypothetical protein [uncultured Nocardioides sp.]
MARSLLVSDATARFALKEEAQAGGTDKPTLISERWISRPSRATLRWQPGTQYADLVEVFNRSGMLLDARLDLVKAGHEYESEPEGFIRQPTGSRRRRQWAKKQRIDARRELSRHASIHSWRHLAPGSHTPLFPTTPPVRDAAEFGEFVGALREGIGKLGPDVTGQDLNEAATLVEVALTKIAVLLRHAVLTFPPSRQTSMKCLSRQLEPRRQAVPRSPGANEQGRRQRLGRLELMDRLPNPYELKRRMPLDGHVGQRETGRRS